MCTSQNSPLNQWRKFRIHCFRKRPIAWCDKQSHGFGPRTVLNHKHKVHQTKALGLLGQYWWLLAKLSLYVIGVDSNWVELIGLFCFLLLKGYMFRGVDFQVWDHSYFCLHQPSHAKRYVHHVSHSYTLDFCVTLYRDDILKKRKSLKFVHHSR